MRLFIKLFRNIFRRKEVKPTVKYGFNTYSEIYEQLGMSYEKEITPNEEKIEMATEGIEVETCIEVENLIPLPELIPQVQRTILGRVRYFVIHCTATPEGREVTPDDIRRWHLQPRPQGNGWRQVGYRWLVRLTGEIDELVPTDWSTSMDDWAVTNGVGGMNSITQHIVYAGGVDRGFNAKDTRTQEQKDSLEKMVRKVIEHFPNVKIGGHNQFAIKACPSFDVPKWLREIGISEENILI